MLEEELFDYFKIENNFKEIENIQSTLIFGNEDRPIPLITFSIPTFKRVRTLQETIDSILSQDLDCDYDIVIVDNNPERRDDTEMLLEEYKKYDNIRYYKNNQNVGMAGNWNKCFTLPKSEWVVLLHDDDMVRSDYLRNILPCLSAEVDAIFPVCSYFKDGKPIPKYTPHETIVLKKKNLNDMFLSNNPPSGIIMRREKVIELGGYTKRNFAPDIFLAKMVYYANTYVAQKPLTLYRVGLNESTKIEAMDKMCTLNYYFRVQAWPKMQIRKQLIEKALPFCHLSYQNLFRNAFTKTFNYSLMPNYTKRQMMIARLICWYYSIKFKIERMFLRPKKIVNVIQNES